jgi:hypothetical protein
MIMAVRMFSPVHSKMWVDPRITKMKPESLLLLIYLMTNHHVNGAGYYFFNPKYAVVDLPLDQEAVDRAFVELETQGFLISNPLTHALLLVDWFQHNPMSSYKNALHFVNLFEQRRVPQNEPGMELPFFCNLFNAAIGQVGNDNFGSFFNFLERNMERLEPGLFDRMYSEYIDSGHKESPSSTGDDFSQGGIQ